jgi:hypothetical protein
VDLNPNDPPIVSQSHDTGVSVAIRANGKEITGKAPTTGLIEKVFTSGGAVSVNLHGEAGNPLSSPAPAIIQDYTINLSTDDGNTIDYDIVGHTKFYPAYEIYIGCRLITGVGTPYMPPPGTTAASLVFPALRPVEAHGQISASDASGCDPPGLSFPPVRP